MCYHDGAVCSPKFAIYLMPIFEALCWKAADTELIWETNYVPTTCGINRMLRKIATTRAACAGYGERWLDGMNRWRTAESTWKRGVRNKMSMLCAEALLMMPVTWRYSHAL